jgi:hypothetical protein
MSMEPRRVLCSAELASAPRQAAGAGATGARATRAAATAGATTAASATATATAAAAAAAAATGTAPATASAAPATASAPPASGRKLQALAEVRCPAELLIKDVEGAQADVGDFLLTEDGDGGQRGSFRRRIGHRGNCRRCAAGHRQRHSGSSPGRQGYLRTLSLRRSLRLRHFKSSLASSEQTQRLMIGW